MFSLKKQFSSFAAHCRFFVAFICALAAPGAVGLKQCSFSIIHTAAIIFEK